MIVLGLTGSIGMGKTTTSAMFASEGAAVYDADAAVHALYGPGGAAGPALAQDFADAVRPNGAVDRERLKVLLKADPKRMQLLESVVFPLLVVHRQAMLDTACAEGRRLAVLDIPLLFETGGQVSVDAVVVVTAAPEIQRQRVMARPGMDVQTFELLLGRQLNDAEKRRRADFVVFTDHGLGAAHEQVRKIVSTVLKPGWRIPAKRAPPMPGAHP